jgi:hypothetical protein
MSGNVDEWEDSCGDTGCYLRGGSYESQGAGDVACKAGSPAPTAWPRDAVFGAVGFRCCKEP